MNCNKGPPEIDPQICCRQPQKDHIAMGKCFAMLGQFFGLPPTSGNKSESGAIPKGGQCVSECLLKEWKILKNGTIDIKAAIERSKVILANETLWKPVYASGIRFCAAEANKVKNQKLFTKTLNGTKVDGLTTCRYVFINIFITNT